MEEEEEASSPPLKLIVHIATVAADEDPLIHLVAITGGGTMLYLYTLHPAGEPGESAAQLQIY